MPLNDLHSQDSKTPSTTLWLPPLSLKEQQQINKSRRRQHRPGWALSGGFKDKTVWDYLNLLTILAIPVLIAAGTLWYTNQQTQATFAVSNQQHQTDLSIAEDQQEETALQTYLDQMSDLLFTEHLATSQPGDEVRQVARARTLTLLPQINGKRKGEVIQFLHKARLIGYIQPYEKLSDAIIALYGADLSGADLSGANLIGVDLDCVNLNSADLSGADLTYVDLDCKANLNSAKLYGANLSIANLYGANLRNATNTTTQQLNSTSSLAGTTLPDGSEHP